MRIGRLLPAALCLAAAGGGAPAAPASAQEPLRLTYRTGPVELGGYETRQDAAWTRAPRRSGSITRMSVRIVDAAGRTMPQERVMLHHVLFLNHGRFRGDRQGTDCARRPREPFFGTGEESQALTLPPGYGYPIRARDRWQIAWMLMNHRHEEERVFLEYTVELAPPGALEPVTPHWITVACTHDRIYNVPGGGGAGSRHARDRLWTVPETGRIVAAAGHAHGGVTDVAVQQPACGDRRLLSSAPQYGPPDDPLYQLSPVLHEPSPRSLSWAVSATGWDITRGEQLRVRSIYDNERPHTKVMGIVHLYVAAPRPGAPAEPCAPLPADETRHDTPFAGSPGRAAPPPVQVQLSRRAADGPARPVGSVGGRTRFLRGGATIHVRRFAFRPPRLSVPAGATIRWRFDDAAQHDVTAVAGPVGFASEYLGGGHTYQRRLTVPGDYRLYCSLHPVDMSQEVHVRP
jgi:plastocyanin